MAHTKLLNLKKLVFLIFLIFFAFPSTLLAEEGNFVTIINPVRIAPYTKMVSKNIETQYQTIKGYSLPATWLVTYDILDNPESIKVLKSMNEDQEVGLFLEVGEKLTTDIDIKINKGYWHDPSVIFLSGYKQEDRIKLIDRYFEKYKEIFGYYPETVGSWWTDSYSLSYMQEKYGVKTNLGVTDQFSTDEYRIWGTYWSTPYYPSKTHLGIPAQSEQNKLDVVVLQWAARDPYKGYESSLYSTQDFFVLKPPQKIDYFEYLLKTYALKKDNEFGQMVVGLESDFSSEVYTPSSNFGKEVKLVSEYRDRGELAVVTAKEFSNWYRGNFPDTSPVQQIKSENFFTKDEKVIWYSSPFYRLMAREKEGKAEVLDFRVYQSEAVEPYYFVPNYDNFLNINIGSVIDNISNKKENLLLNINIDDLQLEDKKTNISDLDKYFYQDKIIKGYEFKSLPLSVISRLQSKKFILILGVLPTLLLVILFYIRKNLRIALVSLFTLYLCLLGVWIVSRMETFYVTSDEVAALTKLGKMEGDTVLVMDNNCLQCTKIDGHILAAHHNKKGYVKKLTGKSIVYSGIINSVSLENAKTELSKLRVDYLYLVNVADYKEVLPYSPGDWGVELVFDNANAQIWKVIK